MMLDNLLRKRLEAIKPDKATIRRWLAAAERDIADASVAEVSNEPRFDAAYKASGSLRTWRCKPMAIAF
jgi:hypothetical protein